MESGQLDGWPRHWACCQKTGGADFEYCATHEGSMFQPPKTTSKELIRSLRKHTS